MFYLLQVKRHKFAYRVYLMKYKTIRGKNKLSHKKEEERNYEQSKKKEKK